MVWAAPSRSGMPGALAGRGLVREARRKGEGTVRHAWGSPEEVSGFATLAPPQRRKDWRYLNRE